MDTIVIDQFDEPEFTNTKELPPILPVWKFLLLTLFTFDLYLIYWFYRIWKHVKAKEGSDIMPVWRAIFGVIFSFSLADKIKEYALSRNISSSLNSMAIGIGFLILNAVTRLPDPFWAIGFLSPLLFIQPLKELNEYSAAEGQVEKGGLSIGEITIFLIGGILLALVFIGLFMGEA